MPHALTTEAPQPSAGESWSNGLDRLAIYKTWKTWLYLAHCGDDLRKIGASVDPWRRALVLYAQHKYKFEFELERTWERPLGDARIIEMVVHRHLRSSGVRKRPDLGREFYIASEAELVGVVEWAIIRAGWR